MIGFDKTTHWKDSEKIGTIGRGTPPAVSVKNTERDTNIA